MMAVPNPNNGGDPRGDDGPDDAPQNSWRQYGRYSTPADDHVPIDMRGWHVTRMEPPSFAGTMSELLRSQGYTVIPPTAAASSRQAYNLVSTLDSEIGMKFLLGIHPFQLNSILGVDEHRTQNGLQTDRTRLSEAQAGAPEAGTNAVEARNNASGASNNASEARSNASGTRSDAAEARVNGVEARNNAVEARSNAAGTRNNATEARNGAASKNKKSKKKKWEKNKKQNQEEKVCPLFQESGQCRYGDNCKFSHLLPDTLPSPDDKVNNPDSPKKEENSPIDLFFGKYPKFDYMRDNPLWDEFDRMNQHFKWRGAEKHQIRTEFHIALVKEFNHVFGMDEGSLESWGKLCAAMGLSTPTTLEEAHKIVRDAYVNLVVLVQSPRTGEPVKVFKNAQDLKKFTAETKWAFPQQHVQAGGLLKMLLRKMGGPSHGPGSRGKKKAVAK